MPPNSHRPFIQSKVTELRAYTDAHWDDLPALISVATELTYRSTNAARSLANLISGRVTEVTAATPSAMQQPPPKPAPNSELSVGPSFPPQVSHPRPAATSRRRSNSANKKDNGIFLESNPFVESSENDFGTGKLIRLNDDRFVVHYFRSPADKQPLESTVSKASLNRVTLAAQTRVYHQSQESTAWAVGRVLAYHSDDDTYFVQFPNKKKAMIASDELQVRCRLPIVAPIDHLAYQLNETAFWHQARSEFVRHLLEQHANNKGLPALVSSSVELVAHQAAVIHRVLHDPFQRYLLADEVGLGKTIEAGALVKQFTLDEPNDHETVIIVPDTLLIQWQQELTHRFHLGRLIGNSIHIVSIRDRNALANRISSARMIVIDEAHHLSSWAWSSDPTENSIFATVKAATEELDRRVLLLSATPVLHNEQSFLAMLHLLDPQVYPLDGLESFKERVRLRQEIAERMMDLREDESNYFLGDTLDVLGGLLSQDEEFQKQRSQLKELIQDDVDEDDPFRISLIRCIRAHVSDTWCLHRRILRNRRNDSTSAYLPGRGGAKRVIYESESERGLADAVETWRLTLSSALFSADATEKRTAIELARIMEELAVCEPHHALEFATQRLSGGDSVETGSLSLCDGESDQLRQIIRAAKECDQQAKMQALLGLVDTEDTDTSYVVFTNSAETGDRVAAYLNSKLPPGRVLRHSTSQLAWTRFQSESCGYVLICDRSAEEGLNLQKRGVVAVHYDLPFSPNRIEQRMGRLDRFGSGKPIESIALLCSGSGVQTTWFDLLADALSVFDRSIASLQYVIEDAMQKLWDEFLDSGTDAIRESCNLLEGNEGAVATESKRIRAQDEIDSFDSDLLTQENADELQEKDFRLSRSFHGIFRNWAVEKLGFSIWGEETRNDDVFFFKFRRKDDSGRRRDFFGKPLKAGRDTLLPVDEFHRLFCHSIDEDSDVGQLTQPRTVPFSFDRVVAQKRSCRLLRVGDPFVDEFEAFTRWDDRGICYAFWRFIPDYQSEGDPELYYCFDYVVSPDPQPFVDLCERNVGASHNALMRRSRAIMRPQFATVWVDADLELVTDNRRRALLKPSFTMDQTPHVQDFNLNRDRWNSASTVHDMSLWRDRCFAARERSERLLREKSKLPEWSEECVVEAKRLASQVQQQYRSRLAMADGNSKAALESELAFEQEFLDAQVESFRSPELRVDSVGAVFLSNQMPFVEPDTTFEDED